MHNWQKDIHRENFATENVSITQVSGRWLTMGNHARARSDPLFSLSLLTMEEGSETFSPSTARIPELRVFVDLPPPLDEVVLHPRARLLHLPNMRVQRRRRHDDDPMVIDRDARARFSDTFNREEAILDLGGFEYIQAGRWPICESMCSLHSPKISGLCMAEFVLRRHLIVYRSVVSPVHFSMKPYIFVLRCNVAPPHTFTEDAIHFVLESASFREKVNKTSENGDADRFKMPISLDPHVSKKTIRWRRRVGDRDREAATETDNLQSFQEQRAKMEMHVHGYRVISMPKSRRDPPVRVPKTTRRKREEEEKERDRKRTFSKFLGTACENGVHDDDAPNRFASRRTYTYTTDSFASIIQRSN